MLQRQHNSKNGENKMYDQVLKTTRDSKNCDMANTSGFKAMVILADILNNNGIPRKFAAKIKFDLGNNFFDNEAKATETIENFSLSIINIYNALEKEFGYDIWYVFENMMDGMSLTANGGSWYDDSQE